MAENDGDNFLRFYDSSHKFSKSSGKIVDSSDSSKWLTIMLSETPTTILFQKNGSIISVQEPSSEVGNENEHHRESNLNAATSAHLCDRFMQTCISKLYVSFGSNVIEIFFEQTYCKHVILLNIMLSHSLLRWFGTSKYRVRIQW